LKFIKQIPKDIEIFVVFSKSSKKSLKLENGIKTKEIFKDYENITLFKEDLM
jgi:4-hydroxy-3-polyprenylbenzoate decarboxylase